MNHINHASKFLYKQVFIFSLGFLSFLAFVLLRYKPIESTNYLPLVVFLSVLLILTNGYVVWLNNKKYQVPKDKIIVGLTLATFGIIQLSIASPLLINGYFADQVLRSCSVKILDKYLLPGGKGGTRHMVNVHSLCAELRDFEINVSALEFSKVSMNQILGARYIDGALNYKLFRGFDNLSDSKNSYGN